MFFPLIYSICFIALAIASYSDIKTREVPDWLNFSLIASGLGIRLIYSVVMWDMSFILYGLFGLLVFVIIAYLMFYAGQWGGGDSKMLMGLGAIIGFELKVDSFLVGFLINVLLIGAAYGLLWSTYLVIKNRKKFVNKFGEVFKKRFYRRARRIMLLAMLLVFVLIVFIKDKIFRLGMLSLMIILLISFYLWVYMKVFESVVMHKYVEPSDLTEGDWIVKEIKINGEYICGPKDLGIEKEQIRKLIKFKKLGKIKKVLIKEGIPFVPSFFLAFVITLLYGNFILRILGF